MATRHPPAPRLTDDQLRDVLALAKGADSIELKLTVPASGQRSAVNALKVDPLGAQIRQVFFYDTPDLALSEAGIVLRARRIQGKGEDSVVKMRPVRPEDLAEEFRRSPAMNVEVDAMPGGYVCSATLKGRPAPGEVRAVHLREMSIRKLFNKEQRAFLDAHTASPVDLDSLSILGPIFVLKVAFTPDGFNRRLVAEMWLYPDGSRILELSTKCPPAEMLNVAAEARLFLNDHGIELSAAQETKTRTAMNFYSKELRAAAPKS